MALWHLKWILNSGLDLHRKKWIYVWGREDCVSCDTENEQSTHAESTPEWDQEQEEVVASWDVASCRVP